VRLHVQILLLLALSVSPLGQRQASAEEVREVIQRDSYSANLALANFEYQMLRMDRSLAYAGEAAKVADSKERKAVANLAQAYAWWGRDAFDIAYGLTNELDPRELVQVSDRVRFFALRGWLEGVLARPKLADKNFRQALREATGDPSLSMDVRLAWLSALLSVEDWEMAQTQLLEAYRLSPNVESVLAKLRLVELESRLDAAQGAGPRAIARLQDAMTLASLAKAPIWEARLQHLQAKLLARESDFELAFLRLEASQATLLKESVSSELPNLCSAWVTCLYLREDDFQGVEEKAFELAKQAANPTDRFRLLEVARLYSLRDERAAVDEQLKMGPGLESPRQELQRLRLATRRARDEGDRSAALDLLSQAETLARQLRTPNLPPSVPIREPSLLQLAQSRIQIEYPHRGPAMLVAIKEELRKPATAQNSYDRCILRGKALEAAIHLFDIDEATAQARAIVAEATLTPITGFARNAVEVGLVHIFTKGDRRGLQPVPNGFRLGDPAAREVLSRLSRDAAFLEQSSTILQTRDPSLGGKSSEPHRLAFWGQFLTALGRFEEAEVALKRGLALAQQENSRVMTVFLSSELARHYFARQKVSAATNQMRVGLDAAPERFRTELLEALIFLEYQAGQRSEATHRAFLAATKEESAPRQRLLRGLSHFSLREPKQAKLEFKKVRDFPRYKAMAEFWLAKVLLTEGNNNEAQEILEALLQAEGISTDPVSQSDISLLLGPLLEDEDALRLYRQSAQQLLSTGASLDTEGGLLGLERNQELLKKVVETALRLGQDELAFDYLKRARSLVLLDEIRKNHPRGETAQLLGRLDQLRQTLVKLESSAQEQTSGDVLSRTRQEFFTTLTRLRQSDPRFQQLVNFRAGDLARVQSLLPPKSILLMPYPSEQSLRLMAVRPDRFRVISVPVGRELLHDTVRQYHHLLTRANSSRSQRIKLGGELFAWLLSPLESSLEDVETVLFVPTEELWYLPLASLPMGGGTVSEHFSVSLLTSTDLIALTQSPQKFRGAELALLSNDLQGASRETAEIAQAFPGSRLIPAERATAKALVQEAREAQVLHLATHGHVNPEQLEKSSLELADGPFALTDIYELTLKSGSLVVLSACQTGVAEKDPGREVASLANAFMTAGASSVVASLWSVDDAVTRRLFVSFYRHLANGTGRAKALRLAQQEVAADPNTSHPYYWAAFFLAGDPR
jgi:CHAT domain-containing protein